MACWCYRTVSSILLLNADSAVAPLSLASLGILALQKFDWLIEWMIFIDLFRKFSWFSLTKVWNFNLRDNSGTFCDEISDFVLKYHFFFESWWSLILILITSSKHCSQFFLIYSNFGEKREVLWWKTADFKQNTSFSFLTDFWFVLFWVYPKYL